MPRNKKTGAAAPKSAKSKAAKSKSAKRRKNGGKRKAAPRLARAQGSSVLRVVPQADLAILDPGITTATVTRPNSM